MKVRVVCALIALAASAPRAQNAGPDPAFFQSQVFPVFEAAKCSGCHTSSGVASATRLHFPEKDATPAQIQAFGLSLSVLVDRADAAQSLLVTKPTNVARHTGGLRIQPGSPEEQVLSRWVVSLAEPRGHARRDDRGAARRREMLRRSSSSVASRTRSMTTLCATCSATTADRRSGSRRKTTWTGSRIS
jgi:hypothetical protein